MGRVGLLPRSGYTEQPRALALGRAVSKSALKAPPTPRPRGAIRKRHIATIPARIPTEKPSRGRGRRRGRERCASQVASDVGRAAGITREQFEDAARPPLFLLRPTFPELRRTGRADFVLGNPGLRPWAVMYSRFAAKSATFLRDPQRKFGDQKRPSGQKSLGPLILVFSCLDNKWEEANGPYEQHLVFFGVSTTVFYYGSVAGRALR
jgi:hypothetical protein